MAEHNTLTGASLHEPKGVAAASANTVYVANGAASGAWTTFATWLLTQIAATLTEIARVADVSTRLILAGNTLTLTEATHEMKVIGLNSTTGSVVTLPAATGGGAMYRFVVVALATSNSHIVKVPNASTIIQGSILLSDTDTAGTVTAFSTAVDSDTITLNRSTSGSVLRGEWFEVMDIATNVFSVVGVVSNTGAGTTPFSATV